MPTPTICPFCGAPIAPGSSFCTECGKPVSSMQQPTNNGEATQKLNAVAPYGPREKHYTSHTITTPAQPMPTPVPSPAPAPYMPAQSKSKTNTYLLVLLGAVLGVLIALVVIVVVPQLQAGQSDSQQAQASAQTQSDQTDASTDTGSSDDDDAIPSNTATTETTQPSATASQQQAQADEAARQAAQAQAAQQADNTFHSSLVGYYSALSSYDDRIRSAAETFNNNYVSGSISTRSDYAYSASSLLSELQAQRDSLYSLSMPTNSAYATQFSQLKQCYDDCVKRIAVVAEAWNNSIQYSDPKAHQEEIIAPIAADNVGGNNRYYTDFNNVYPQINL